MHLCGAVKQLISTEKQIDGSTLCAKYALVRGCWGIAPHQNFGF